MFANIFPYLVIGSYQPVLCQTKKYIHLTISIIQMQAIYFSIPFVMIRVCEWAKYWQMMFICYGLCIQKQQNCFRFNNILICKILQLHFKNESSLLHMLNICYTSLDVEWQYTEYFRNVSIWFYCNLLLMLLCIKIFNIS